MAKRLIMLLLITGAMMSMGIRILQKDEKSIPARLVMVTRHNVHQVKAITGVLGYTEEEYVCAPVSGIVTEICVNEEQRVSSNEALLRLEENAQGNITPSLQALEAYVAAFENTEDLIACELSQHRAVRSQKDCTVRQVLVSEGTSTTTGTPLLRLSSNEQIIRCTVTPKDLEAIHPGQWAWMYAGEDTIGYAEVIAVEELLLNARTGLLESTVSLKPTQHIELPEGSVIDFEVFIAGSSDVPALPIEAITNRSTVWWVNQGRCTEIPAEIVMSDEMYAWVNLPEGLLVAVGEFAEGQLVSEAEI